MAEIKSRSQAAQVVQRMAHLTALLGCAVAQRDAEVLKVQEKHHALIINLSKDLTFERERLQAWADANRRKEFADSQSLELPHGWLRFRMGNRALDFLEGWTEEKVLKKLKSFGAGSQWSAYIRCKETVNNQKLLADSKADTGPGAPALPEAMLKKVGLAIVREERFEVECKPEMFVADVPCP